VDNLRLKFQPLEAEVTFTCYLKGSGREDIAPEWLRLVRACRSATPDWLGGVLGKTWKRPTSLTIGLWMDSGWGNLNYWTLAGCTGRCLLGTVRNSVREAGFVHQAWNLSPKMPAYCVLASNPSRGGRFHSWAA